MKPLPKITELTRPYWDAAARGRLVLQRCKNCQRYIFYPRPLCPRCWSRDLSWTEVSGRGRVVTWTVVYQPPSPAFAGDTPYVLAVIALAEGPQMMANVMAAGATMRIDLPVRVTFERRGEISIPQFEPDPEGGAT